MYQASDWIKAVTRLTKLTVNGTLVWQAESLDDVELLSPSDKLKRAFSCEHKEKKYRVLEVSTRIYMDEENFYWTEIYYLDILERPSPISWYQFVTRSPELPVISDLFRTVERKHAYQKGALNDLLDANDDTEIE